MTHDGNLFVALRAGFPDDLDRAAIETIESGLGLHLARPRAGDGDARQPARFARPADGEPDRGAGREVGRVAALLPGRAARRPRLPAAQHRLQERRDRLLHRRRRARRLRLRAEGFRLGVEARLRRRDDVSSSPSATIAAAACSSARPISPTDAAPAQRASDDLAAILYTSGTTGRSKGAMLTHGNLLSNAAHAEDVLGLAHAAEGGDVLIHALPIFHVHGLFVASHGALLAGARMLWLGRFDARRVVELLPRATVFMGVPTLYVRLLAEPTLTREACRNMRLFISGSAPLLLDTFEAFRERTGHTILERYGMSETVMLTSNPYDPADGERRGGTVGFPLPGVAAAHRRRRRRRRCRGHASARSRCAARTSSPATGGCRRRRARSSAPTAGSAPATSAIVDDRGYAAHRRPQQGPHHQRRLQRLPGRDRGRLNELPGRRRDRRRRRARTPTSARPSSRSSWRAPARAVDAGALTRR